MKKLLLVVLLLAAAGVYALSANLVITETNGLTMTFQCQAVGFTAETYDWDVGFRPDHLVLYDVTDDTVTYTFEEGEFGRASCTAWDQETGEVGVSEIYFDVGEPAEPGEADLNDVSFRGCSEVWIVFDAFEGPVDATILTSDGPREVTIENEDITMIPGQYGDLPLYKWNVHDNIGDAKILGVIIEGQTFTNTNNCASRGNSVASSKKGR